MQPRWSRAERELLSATPLFRGAEAGDLRWALEDPRCTRERFEKGAEIYSPQSFRRCLGVVLRGTARVTKGELVVSTLGPGDLFGAAALFHQRGVYETTITPREACIAAFFPQKLVAELMSRSPTVCGNYIRYLSERIHFLNQKIEGLTAPNAVGKLAVYLWTESRKSETVACSATELARRLDVSRATLYRALEQLEGDGVIRREGKQVVVLDRERLGTAPSAPLRGAPPPQVGEA